jgi:hypothetical protein
MCLFLTRIDLRIVIELRCGSTWYGGKSAKGFSAKYFQRIENSETKLSERIFELRARVQSVGEGEMYFRYCAFRAFFCAERDVRSNTFR